MSFGCAVKAMIDSLKANARPKRNPFSNHLKVYRNENLIDIDDLNDSIEFRKTRMDISVKRSFLIWFTILLISVIFVILFPYL